MQCDYITIRFVLSTAQKTADWVTFTEKILNGKFYFLCSVLISVRYWPHDISVNSSIRNPSG